MSTIYLENQYQISSETLAKIQDVESIPYINEVEENVGDALKFAWQWLRGDTVFEQATSGSTGLPKKISIHRDQMIASAQATIQALSLTESDSSLLCLSAQYIGGKVMVVRSLLAKMNLVIVRPTSNPLPYLSFLPKFTALVPLQIQALLDEKEATALNQMKAIIIGGAPVSTSQEEQIRQELTVSVYSTYGMTETVSHIALKKLTLPDAQNFYQVLGDTQIALDERDCLKIKGKVTQDEWVITNDIVELLGERKFRWLGRYDSVINSGGVKVFPEEVEKVLEPIVLRENFTGRLLVSSLPDKKLGERIILILEGDPLSDDQKKKVLKEAHQQLSPYQVPKVIYYLPKFSETPTGKVQRSQTQQQLLQSLAS
ncbi:MAG: AMP-binding protein [Bacteroidota bacterium]